MSASRLDPLEPRSGGPLSPGADWLHGEGDMVRLMRAADWSASPLGPPETWPTSLRTAAGICLSSRFPMAICWGPRYAFLYNDAYAPVLGTKHPEALGQPCLSVWHEIADIIRPMFEGVLTTGAATWSADLMLPMLRHGYLEETYFTFSYSAVRGESGRPEGIFVTCTETTERFLAERRLELVRELGESAGEARSLDQACRLLEQALSAHRADVPFSLLYRLDPSSTSARLAAATGLERGDARAPAQLEPYGASATWPLARALEAGEPVLLELTGELAGCPSGAWPEPARHALLLPLSRPGTSQVAAVLVAGVNPRRALDATHREFFRLVGRQIAAGLFNAMAHEEARERAEMLLALDRAKTAFFSNVSHEFRTPLTLMLGPIEELERCGLRPEEAAQIDLLRRNAARLLKLVNTLLEFARAEAGRARARFEPTDLAELTREFAGLFRSAIERAGLRLDVDCPPLPEPIHVDRDLWEKIVLNLLSNALKHTFEGSITVTLRHLGTEARLEVRDTGVGIAAEELPHIFERFHRASAPRARSHEGSGIGLALVQELARLHGGDASVESAAGHGATFRVTVRTGRDHLPAAASPEGEAPPEGAAPPSARAYVEEAERWLPPALGEARGEGEGSANVDAARPRILVVDDNADMRDYLVRLLERTYRVETAGDGQEALHAARRTRPDLVLSDVMMPGLDGFGLLRALREDERTRNLPLIMLSARAGEDARVEGIEAGADDYLVKPFGARELLARVRAQLAVAAARRAAEAQRESLYVLFQQAPVPICVLRGDDLVFETANPHYLRLTGGREVLGRKMLDVFPELAGQGFDEILLEVMRTGRPHLGQESLVRYAPHDDGRVVDTYFTFTFAPLRDGNERVTRAVVICTEVTEQVRARAEVEEARRKSEEASRAKDEFLAMLGHELRNPLAPIATALELMKLRAPELLVKERAVIERQLRHLVSLVDDLLDVARVARGMVQLRRRRVDVAEVAARAIELASPMLEERRHHLSFTLPGGLVVDGDEMRLTQVLANLLTNAAKYTAPGGRISLSGAQAGEHVELRVVDTGIGIPPELAPRVFDLFVQGARPSGGQGGLGLGLSLVKSLVELHGGTVHVRSEGPGKGSEFLVRLPRAAAAQVFDAQEPPVPPKEAQARLRRRILVVDDNRDAAESLAETLAAMGYETRTVFDGPTALEIAASFSPDVALIDIGMPVMDGYELARRLRDQPGGERVRLVAVTGYGQEKDRARTRRLGFSLHLVKPVDFAQLTASLERWFDPLPGDLSASPQAAN